MTESELNMSELAIRDEFYHQKQPWIWRNVTTNSTYPGNMEPKTGGARGSKTPNSNTETPQSTHCNRIRHKPNECCTNFSSVWGATVPIIKLKSTQGWIHQLINISCCKTQQQFGKGVGSYICVCWTRGTRHQWHGGRYTIYIQPLCTNTNLYRIFMFIHCTLLFKEIKCSCGPLVCIFWSIYTNA